MRTVPRGGVVGEQAGPRRVAVVGLAAALADFARPEADRTHLFDLATNHPEPLLIAGPINPGQLRSLHRGVNRRAAADAVAEVVREGPAGAAQVVLVGGVEQLAAAVGRHLRV